ncbi:MAG: hypothetical protein Q8O10_03240 [candidate division Zixibacteria bacterium]|nr:hypothetical protein [candidate division Zixibacteria bacterium]
MSKSKKKEIEPISQKLCWHPYKLQKLNLQQFIKVVNKILNEELEILDIREEKSKREE